MISQRNYTLEDVYILIQPSDEPEDTATGEEVLSNTKELIGVISEELKDSYEFIMKL